MTGAGPRQSSARRTDWASVILVACAVLVTLSVGAQQVRNWLHPGGDPPAPRPPEKPVYVKDWKSLIAPGELIGSASAPVIVAEFGDFQCPVCRGFKRSVDSVLKLNGDRVALVFVHFPLNEIHPFAEPAAQASECAAGQGRFAQYYELLYSKQDSLGRKSWRSFAQDAGVADLAAFDKCAADPALLPRITAGRASAVKLGATGTPTVLVNGWRFNGAVRTRILDSAIKAMLRGAESR